MKPILEVQGLCKNYPTFGLRDVNFTLPENCITGFIGANGSGKTKTIRTILGLCSRDAGEIRVFGQDMATHEKEIKNRLGVVLDGGSFYENLTMAEMKSILAPAYSNWNEAEFRQRMDRFGLHPKQKISTLSKGMHMKFSLALALSHQAELLIMDEPTDGLDPLVRGELMDLLLEFMEQEGKSVFFSTHITSDLDKIADMLILIDNGHILWEQEKDTLLDTHSMVKGNTVDLNEENRRLFLTLRETSVGFTGLTKEKQEIKRKMPSVLLERPTVEDIMLGYIEGRR